MRILNIEVSDVWQSQTSPKSPGKNPYGILEPKMYIETKTKRQSERFPMKCGSIGLYRGSIGGEIGDVLFLLLHFVWYFWFSWFIIGLKVLIKARGWIPICFLDICGTFNILTKYGPLDPLFITKIL